MPLLLKNNVSSLEIICGKSCFHITNGVIFFYIYNLGNNYLIWIRERYLIRYRTYVEKNIARNLIIGSLVISLQTERCWRFIFLKMYICLLLIDNSLINNFNWKKKLIVKLKWPDLNPGVLTCVFETSCSIIRCHLTTWGVSYMVKRKAICNVVI